MRPYLTAGKVFSAKEMNVVIVIQLEKRLSLRKFNKKERERLQIWKKK